MTLVVTCGPAWEPIDGMRRLTNASTGTLGTVLARAFHEAGHRVLLFRGETSTAEPPRAAGITVTPFGTNDDLSAKLESIAARESVGAVFHAAALCDFRVARVVDSHGAEVRMAKVPSRGGALRLDLEPATKVLPRLRGWFPEARLVGWKYELNGSRDEALERAWTQIRECRTDACVVNGAAWGAGFGLCELPGRVTPCADMSALAALLVSWIPRPGS